MSRRDLLLLTCLVYVHIFIASFFPSFIYDLLKISVFFFVETKLTKGTVWRTSPVLKYNFKERD